MITTATNTRLLVALPLPHPSGGALHLGEVRDSGSGHRIPSNKSCKVRVRFGFGTWIEIHTREASGVAIGVSALHRSGHDVWSREAV
jgi:hypothetical protein